MNLWQTLAISQSGMNVEQLRAETAARNLANSHVAQAPGSPPVKPLRVLAKPGPAPGFAAMVGHADGGRPVTGVSGVVYEAEATPRRVLDPGHPYADAKGYVSYPGINGLDEMFSLTLAVRAYEANVTAFNAARSMALKALDIGGR
ncbi:flagellar basal body rod protein FlgC [Paludibacterium paludis]|uniref:Flagellar basal-body rod protein FlgC n=1 Tax=Paludibacterium paludis TaxID=1225769 RepID=A0A918P706_9NEIS|nr:flagellar basal body rod C-terminal domain-containing protein [Paludibacterium paludis]GGY28820.1 flagellar basal-body rod protein FlgC [Paludibacterium paludis]